MGNAIKGKYAKSAKSEQTITCAYCKKIIKPFFKLKGSGTIKCEGKKFVEFEDKAIEVGNEEDSDDSCSWTTTIDTRSSFSFGNDESEGSVSVDTDTTSSKKEWDNSSSGDSRTSSTSDSEGSNTSADFSSFDDLSKMSERHSIIKPRPKDLEWISAVKKYHKTEPVSSKKHSKAALPIRSRRIVPKLNWKYLYHRWAMRQPPQDYKKNVHNPYIEIALQKNSNIDLLKSDLERGIFYLKSSNC